MEPLVSILMTAYNRELFIKEAIESVLNNTYQNFELIIVDDSSSDSTVSIASTYAASDARISLYKNQHNLGDYPNRNMAATYAKGKYLLYVDSDDILFTDTLQELVHIMENNEQVDLVMVAENNMLGKTIFEPGELIPVHFFKKQVLIIGPGGTFTKRSFFEQIGKYPELYGPANDGYYNLKAASTGRIFLFPRQISYYRIHDGQEINNKYGYLSNNYRYLRDAFNEIDLGLNKEQINWLRKKNKRRFVVNLLKYLKSTGNITKTFEAYRKAGFSIKNVIEGTFH